MSDQYQRVDPTPFDAPGEKPLAASPEAAHASSGRPAWLVPAFAILGVLALFVVFLLPSWVDNEPLPSSPSADRSTPPTDQTTANPRREEPRTEEASSPFADAVEAKARAEAQELLAELLDVQENLTNRGAEEWAPKAMEAIAAEASAGDERYRERDFEPAIGHYQTALDQALALEQSLPQRFSDALAAFDAAVEALDYDSAAAKLALAEQLEPGDPALPIRSTRLESLPEVSENVATAQQAEEARQLSEAVSAMEAAAGLDSAHEFVAAELRRLRAALTEQRFNAAMSEGYAALDENSFDRAQARFERAAKLVPGSAEAATALQELAVARTAATLQALQRRGEGFVAEEDWEQAIGAFEEALAIDGSLRFAREGLALARPRAVLNKELTAIIDQPERLVDAAILREARESLARAKEAATPGPKLRAQISEVESVLTVASTPLSVSVRSDGATEVTVYKVARLGLFEERQLELRPGKYTAVGTRRGFRDVRVVFTVTPGETASVYIACSEAI